MKTRLWLLGAAALTLAPALASGFDLKFVARPHTTDVVFGDPLFFELEVTNQGDTPVQVVEPSPHPGFSVDIRVARSPKNVVYYDEYGKDYIPVVPVITLAPKETRRVYLCAMFPAPRAYEIDFWKGLRGGDGVNVWAEYRCRDNVVLRSATSPVWIRPRRKYEYDRLLNWYSRPEDELGLTPEFDKGPVLGQFGLELSVRTHRRVEAMIAEFRSGEMPFPIAVCCQLQRIHRLPESERAAADAALVQWLRELTHTAVMRRALLHRAQQVAADHKMTSTVKALSEIRFDGP